MNQQGTKSTEPPPVLDRMGRKLQSMTKIKTKTTLTKKESEHDRQQWSITLQAAIHKSSLLPGTHKKVS